MRKLIRALVLCVAAGMAVSISVSTSRADETPRELEGVTIEEHLGAQVPIRSLSFRNEWGEQKPLETYFKQGRPVLLALVYYECPQLCNLLLSGLVDSLKGLAWVPGREFELVAVSIDPKETPEIAHKKKAQYLEVYGKKDSEAGWHFLTGNQNDISALANAVGFRYRYDERAKQFAHPAVITLLSPEGKITRYLYGIHFKAQNLKLGLLDASQGRQGSVGEKLLLSCFHFDPSRNSYTLRMWRVVQVVLTIQVLVLAVGLTFLWRKEKKVSDLIKSFRTHLSTFFIRR